MNIRNLFDLYPDPPSDDMASDYNTTNLLACLAVFTQPKVVVEAGTYQGRTSIAIAKALRSENQDGFHVWTAEINETYVRQAINFAEENHVNEHISFYYGDYLDMLEAVPGDVDFAYIDAGVRWPMVEATKKRMSPNGLILVDDMSGEWGDKEGYWNTRNVSTLYLPNFRGLSIIV
jgi:predicted O-methyltransferase YrrM